MTYDELMKEYDMFALAIEVGEDNDLEFVFAGQNPVDPNRGPKGWRVGDIPKDFPLDFQLGYHFVDCDIAFHHIVGTNYWYINDFECDDMHSFLYMLGEMPESVTSFYDHWENRARNRTA